MHAWTLEGNGMKLVTLVTAKLVMHPGSDNGTIAGRSVYAQVWTPSKRKM